MRCLCTLTACATHAWLQHMHKRVQWISVYTVCMCMVAPERTYMHSAHIRTHTCSTTSFLLVAFLIEYISVLVTSHLRPFAEPSLDRLNLGTLVVTCLVLFYGYTDVRLHALTRLHMYACSIMLMIQPGAAEDPRDRQIQV